jgi:HEAT repeat protein
MQLRPCPFCSKPIPKKITACPYCHRDEMGQPVRMDTAAAAPVDDAKFFPNDLQDLGSDDPFVREQAVVRMAQKGFGVAQALISVLSDLGKPGLAATAKVLGRIKDRRAIDALANAARMGDDDLRTAAIWALGQYREPEILQIFNREIERQHPTLQAYMAFVMSGFHDSTALAPLAKLAKSPNREVAFQAACALGELGDRTAGSALKKAYRHKDPVVRSAAAASLKRLGLSAVTASRAWMWAVGAIVLSIAAVVASIYK